MINRNSYKKIWDKLLSYKNMIFISGPRQAGKTTFAIDVAENFSNKLYFNWDIIENKKNLINNPFFFEELNRIDDTNPLIIFDEIHKYNDWKNYLKGVYDQFNKEYKFLISGSGRLDTFQKGGDSLAGRYLLFHLWPFTLGELSNKNISLDDFLSNPLNINKEDKNISEIWNCLKEFSGFPEPFSKSEKDFYRIWSTTYHHQLLREDIRNFSQIRNMDQVEILFSLLPEKIGSLLSLNNLAQTLSASYESIKNWLDLFEHFFLIFRISPWKKSISRAIIKEKKLYLFDYAYIENKSLLFENMIAVELFRGVSNWNNLGVGKFSLHFVRNKEKEEVDFLIVKNGKPFLLIECKLSDTNVSKSLVKFQNMLNIPAIQLVDKKNVCKLITNGKQKVMIISAARWLAQLP
jgi:uncharacterized protein